MEKEKVTLENLKKALRFSWSKETSNDRDKWTPENPAYGQCAITALIVQDHFGGKLIRYDLPGTDSHYLNRLPDGSEVDLTESQFSEDALGYIKECSPKGTRTRKHVLSYPDTKDRYEFLKQRVEDLLRLLRIQRTVE